MDFSLDKLYGSFKESAGVETDTRKDVSGKIFFALKGENFDGNLFVDQALDKGALLAVSSLEKYRTHPCVMYVPDTLKTLQDLALHHRRQIPAKIIAITGSNGKTTTKELTYRVLSTRYHTLATQGNLNNHIGIPLTLLRLQPAHELAIIEMGTNHFGEIASYCSFTEPDYGYITGFGEAHLEFFGNLEGVIRAKSELYDYLKSRNKLIFRNADDPIQENLLKDYPGTYAFSYEKPVDVSLGKVEGETYVTVEYKGQRIRSHLFGAFHFANVGAAVCMGDFFEISPDKIKKGIESYEPQNNRSQWLEYNTNRIILDAYNANPTSMREALENLAQLPGEKLAVLGDMFELGNLAPEKHQEISDFLGAKKIKSYLIGEHFMQVKPNPFILGQFPDRETFKKSVDLNAFSNHTILIKGSRGMALEKLLE